MMLCAHKTIRFARCKGRQIQVNFKGGEITSDAGAILLNRADKKISLLDRIASGFNDRRCKGKIKHKIGDMLSREPMACLGYEDLNDHTDLLTLLQYKLL